mmetsp:Transcript_50920/g.87598  ORF Transcript_50920/g.87598 Transcript_50920/m.87598 type:complete len:83 (+) Transcript_50920:277-525(+)
MLSIISWATISLCDHTMWLMHRQAANFFILGSNVYFLGQVLLHQYGQIHIGWYFDTAATVLMASFAIALKHDRNVHHHENGN